MSKQLVWVCATGVDYLGDVDSTEAIEVEAEHADIIVDFINRISVGYCWSIAAGNTKSEAQDISANRDGERW